MGLTKSVLSDVAQYLHTKVGSLNIDLFQGTMPGTPANCVVILPTGGIRNVVQDVNAIKRTQFQLIVRDKSFPTGLTRTETIFGLLDNQFNILSGDNQGRIVADHEPGVMFRDENNHCIFSLNFTCTMIRLS